MKLNRLLVPALFLALFAFTGCKPDWPNCKTADHCKENDQGQVVNFVCVQGTCRECGADKDCQAGFICRDFQCVPEPECYTNADCTGGMLCKNEKCVPECTSNAECAAGMRCESNRCVPDVECTTDSDCAEGFECNARGECVELPPPEPTCELQTVYFDFDSYALTDTARQTLSANAGCLRERNAGATLEGHCDERGTEEYNLQLGENRANAVKKFLSTLGVSGGRLKVVSYGEERPAAYGSDEGAWTQNRRVEFKLEAPGL